MHSTQKGQLQTPQLTNQRSTTEEISSVSCIMQLHRIWIPILNSNFAIDNHVSRLGPGLKWVVIGGIASFQVAGKCRD